MLNYIWAGLIITSFVFALAYDIGDIASDRYRNGRPLPVAVVFPEGYDPATRRVPVEIRIDRREYADFYGSDQTPDSGYAGYLLQTQEGAQLRFRTGARLPEPPAAARAQPRSRASRSSTVSRRTRTRDVPSVAATTGGRVSWL
jgi:hypothetical protein